MRFSCNCRSANRDEIPVIFSTNLDTIRFVFPRMLINREAVESDLFPASLFLVGQAAATAVVAVTTASARMRNTRKGTSMSRSFQKRRKARLRHRRSMSDIYLQLGPLYFRRAYRMTYESFCVLHNKLKDRIAAATAARRWNVTTTIGNRKKNRTPPVPNGKPISTSVRLGCALRYFAGASPYDLMVKFGVSYTSVLDSVWIVVEAINTYPDFFIEYPSDFAEQKRIAAEFGKASQVPFDCCAGAIDGILIWINKPSEKDAQKSGLGRKKFFCGRKHKFGLNCQSVSDCRGRILDISMRYGGSASDCIAFEASSLWRRLEAGLLLPGLVFFGDNAYLNSNYMATPYPNVSRGSKDDYNFFHSQVSFLLLCNMKQTLSNTFIVHSLLLFLNCIATHPGRMLFWNACAALGNSAVSHATTDYNQENNCNGQCFSQITQFLYRSKRSGRTGIIALGRIQFDEQ